MEKDEFREHSLDSLLDSESEEEFGEPEIRNRFDHGANKNVNGNLSNWTAQDFASIHVRFRPHLERHAKRYLSNPVQAEEVVQDAFLYLMTTLPELDSELGVLKFLKWKIRLLSIDILRSASNRQEVFVREHDEYAAEDEEMTADLERAEDNAVIRLALSKLNPRQREALIASVYEEKTSDEVAKQLGLSSNATRQLLFRARSAFKNALVGEAEIQGKSLPQVLTIAAKKAALEAKENAVKVGAFIVIAAVGVGILPSLVPASETEVAEAPAQQELFVAVEAQPGTTGDPAEGSSSTEIIEPSESERISQTDTVVENPVETEGAPQSQATNLVDPSSEGLSDQSLSTILTTNVSNAGVYTNSYSGLFGDLFQGMSVEVFGGTGISAFLDLNIEDLSVRQIIFQMWVDGERYYGVARSSDSEIMTNGDGYTIAVFSKEFFVVDQRGNVFSESPLAGSKAIVTLELAEDGTPQSASMKVESTT